MNHEDRITALQGALVFFCALSFLFFFARPGHALVIAPDADVMTSSFFTGTSLVRADAGRRNHFTASGHGASATPLTTITVLPEPGKGALIFVGLSLLEVNGARGRARTADRGCALGRAVGCRWEHGTRLVRRDTPTGGRGKS